MRTALTNLASLPVVVFIALSFAMATAPATGQLPYTLRTSHPIGLGPTAAASGDMDGDGDEDIVVALGGANTVMVVFNEGAFSFTNATPIPVANGPTSVVLADFNNDNALDVAVACRTANRISVSLNNGSGILQPSTSFAAGFDPISLAAMDFDNDGDMDILVSNHFDHRLSFMQNGAVGSASFALLGGFFVGGLPSAIKPADVDRDGDLDILVCSAGFSAVLLIENTGLGFVPFDFFVTGGQFPIDMFVADVNLDGRPDVLTANIGTNQLSVLAGTGGLGFAPAVTFPAGDAPTSIVVTDTDNKLGPDVVVTGFNGNHIASLTNTGVGTFNAQAIYQAGANPVQALGIELDGDFAEDLVVVNFSSNNLAIFENQLPDNRYPGTGEDLELRTGVNAMPATGPGEYVKAAHEGDVLNFLLISPNGTYDGTLAGVGLQAFKPTFPPFTQIPNLYLNTQGFPPVFVSTPSLPSTGQAFSFTIPIGVGLPDLSMLSQGGASSAMANNGFGAFTDAHEIRFAP